VRLRLRRSSSRFLLRSSSNFAILAFSMRNHSTIKKALGAMLCPERISSLIF
jgi:hypothetical protein